MESPAWLADGAAAAAAYLVGGIPFGLIVARAARGIDIREHGSRNIGATNVGRVCGWRWGALVLALDGAKGFAPVFWLAPWIVVAAGRGGEDAGRASVASGLAAILGHLAPPWLGFKGGKGVATSAGVFLALAPAAAGIALAVFLVTVAAFRMVSLGSVVAAVALPAAYALVPPGGFDAVFGLSAAVALLVLFRHRENLQRIAAGTEPKIGRSKS